ncbi:TPA: ead/Ea22-like family protein [Klebsiella pneumoniae]|nr:ead/Ea22-like family protein [Klebsiella pneumoniae]
MTTDITELAQSLKAAAEKATPGEWVYFPKNTSIEYDVGSDESQGSILYVDSGDFTQAQTDRNGEFIALANPANILALVEALEKAQAQSSKWLEAYHKAVSIGARYEERIAELESRTITVKQYDEFQICHYGATEDYAKGYIDCQKNFSKWLTASGIKVEAE